MVNLLNYDLFSRVFAQLFVKICDRAAILVTSRDLTRPNYLDNSSQLGGWGRGGRGGRGGRIIKIKNYLLPITYSQSPTPN